MNRLKLGLLTVVLASTAWIQTQTALAYEDPVIGETNALLHMEIYDDFQCPFCARFHETLTENDQIQNDYLSPGLLRITVRDFPLSFHKNALNAAKAVNSLHEIHPELSFDYMDKLFATQEQWGDLDDPQTIFYEFAQEIGRIQQLAVSQNEFLTHYRDPNNQSEISADINEGKRREVNGTPTFFINGKQYSGAVDLQTLIGYLEAGLRNLPRPENPNGFSASSSYNAIDEVMTVSWTPFSSSSLNYYTIDITATELGDDTRPSDRFIVELPTATIYDQSQTNYSFDAEENTLISVTIKAYDYGDQLLGSTETRMDTGPHSFECPSYEEPACPNGTIVSPPAADGCPGPPYCKPQEDLPPPPAGYEDKVRVKYFPEGNPFTDTDLQTREGKAAADLYFREIIGGFPDGEFKGERLVNRAEAAKFLLLADKAIIPQEPSYNPFRDVIASEWYGPFVLEAARLGIIKGYQDGTFLPAQGVQTDELLSMMARTFDLPLNLPHDYPGQWENPRAWYWDYAGIAQRYQLFPDRYRLQPERQLTRNEVATAIYQYLKNR